MESITGSVERITFYNPENGYSVLRLRPDSPVPTSARSRDGLVTIVGNLPAVTQGEQLKLQGQWKTHAKHGQQFQAEVCEQTLPATVAGIRRYLGSGLVKGIGPRLAERIVDQFGEQTLDVIENTPGQLRTVPDIGPKRVRRIAQAWEEQRQVKDIMLFLHSHAVSTNLAVKIYKQYGANALSVVQKDPYQLARDIYGVGFKTADRLAQSFGLADDHPSRIEAGVVYALDEITNDGHVYAPQAQLVDRATALLGVPAAQVEPAVERLLQTEHIQRETVPFAAGDADAIPAAPHVAEEGKPYSRVAVYLSPLYYAEIGVARRLARLASAFPSRMSDLPPAFTALDPLLSAEQQQAVRTALSQPVSVLTGGPGTGKTTCLKTLIAALELGRKRYALASPTGRAAKRLSEATGRSASTLHRLLGFSPGEGFKHNAENPLAIDMLVVDEASMLDLVLANQLLKALKPGTHLLLVGDVDQLPSVGAGDVLRQVIGSGVIAITRLQEIFRQAADSQIIANAHRINHGEMPQFQTQVSGEAIRGDFFLFPAETPDEAANWVQDVVCKRIPAKFGLEPRDEIQVLAPMYRGAAGVTALNERLQAALNPAAAGKMEKRLYGQMLRVGDKVMQIRNNYDKDVFNGDIGIIHAIHLVEQSLEVAFEGRRVLYDWSETDQLVLAYAVSVHKAQGSEFPAVVIPIVTSHYLMLQRNLLYTAVTRAKKLCVLVGSRRALAIAVHNNTVAQRFTALAWRLRQA